MEITVSSQNGKLILAVKGRIDSNTAPLLNDSVKNNVTPDTTVIMDFADVDYISSAGLRVIVATQKLVSRSTGALAIVNVNETVKEIFEITGLEGLFNIQK